MRTSVERVDHFPEGDLRCLVWESSTGHPLVCWPGLGGTAESYGILAERIPNPVVAIDPPGTGPVSAGLPTLVKGSQILAHVSQQWGEQTLPEPWRGRIRRTIIRIPDMGHEVLLDQPDAVCRAMVEWLDKNANEDR